MSASISLVAQIGPGELPTPAVDWWAVLPILLLAAPAMVLLHVTSLVGKAANRFLAWASVLIALVAGCFAVVLWDRIGDEPYSTLGGALGVDRFGVFVTLVICAAAILASLLADDYLRREGLEGAEMYALILLSAAGGVVMATANDLIVMFLGLEILSIATYVLAAMHLRRIASQESGMKYFVLGAFSSAFFLYGIALVYGATGSTNLVEIHDYLAQTVLTDNQLLLGGFALLLVGFGFKVAAVPFHTWTPDVYQGAPSPVTAWMASGVKAAGFAGLIRVFVVAFGSERLDWQPIVYGLAVLTLFGGAIAAVVQTDVKRMMAFSSINHAGFILLGVQAASARGTSASLFYLAAYAFMVAGSFGVITLVGGPGDARHQLADYRGLSRRKPTIALAFTIFLLAQAGVPLTSGFFAKFEVITAAVDASSYWLGVAAMVSSVIAGFVYLRIIVSMYMADAEADHADGADHGEDAADGETDADAPTGDGGVAVATAPATTAIAPLPVPVGAAIALVLSLAFTVVIGFFPSLLADLADEAIPTLVRVSP